MQNVPYNRLDRKDTPPLIRLDNPSYPFTYDYSYNNTIYPTGSGMPTPTQITSELQDSEGRNFKRVDEYSLNPGEELSTYAYNVIADHCEDLGIDATKVLPLRAEFKFDDTKRGGSRVYNPNGASV